jgi:hypothetical protein
MISERVIAWLRNRFGADATREQAMPHMNRNADGLPLRKSGEVARHGRQKKGRDDAVYIRVTPAFRKALDGSMDRYGPKTYTDALERYFTCHQFLIGVLPEPDWLAAAQAAVQKKQDAEK